MNKLPWLQRYAPADAAQRLAECTLAQLWALAQKAGLNPPGRASREYLIAALLNYAHPAAFERPRLPGEPQAEQLQMF